MWGCRALVVWGWHYDLAGHEFDLSCSIEQFFDFEVLKLKFLNIRSEANIYQISLGER